MLHEIVKYSEIEERNGALYLFDPRRFGLLCRRLDELEKAYHRIRVMLADNDYPTTRQWIEAVATNGAEGFRDCLVEENEKEAKRLKVPRQVAEQWKQIAIQEVDADVWAECRTLSSDISERTQALPPLRFRYSDDEGLHIEMESARDAIKDLCSCKVTDEMRAKADAIIALAEQIRAMELSGLNGIELISKYAPRADVKPGLELYADIATRTHTQGRIEPDMSNIFNQAGIKSAPMII